jgi:hypothetical protein
LIADHSFSSAEDITLMDRTSWTLVVSASLLALSTAALAESSGHHAHVSDEVIAEQRNLLAENTEGAGFGPQSPRDLESAAGENGRAFAAAPAHTRK